MMARIWYWHYGERIPTPTLDYPEAERLVRWLRRAFPEMDAALEELR